MDFCHDGFFWQASLLMPTWSDFTNGEPIPVIYAPEGRDEAPMSPEEIVLVNWVLHNHAMQKPALLSAVLSAYPKFRLQYFSDYDLPESNDELPKIDTVAGLFQVMTLESVNVHQVSKDGAPYVGYEFACKWDDEHGLGVLMHKERIVDLGGVDTACLLWIAEGDLVKTQ